MITRDAGSVEDLHRSWRCLPIFRICIPIAGFFSWCHRCQVEFYRWVNGTTFKSCNFIGKVKVSLIPSIINKILKCKEFSRCSYLTRFCWKRNTKLYWLHQTDDNPNSMSYLTWVRITHVTEKKAWKNGCNICYNCATIFMTEKLLISFTFTRIDCIFFQNSIISLFKECLKTEYNYKILLSGRERLDYT